MRVLFKQKQWIVMQAIFIIVGMLSGLMAKTQVQGSVGGLAVGLSFINKTDEYTFPILLILLSDLAFNVEYVQGTFLTYLLCGQSRKSWMLKKSVTFYLFVLLQYAMAFVAMSLAAGIVTGHFGLEALKTPSAASYNVIVREMGLKVLTTLVFVSFGVLITTLLPGKLVVGSIASIGAVFIGARGSALLYHTLPDSGVLGRILDVVWMQNPDKAWSWIFGLAVFALFALVSTERVRRIEIANRGA